MKSYLLLWALGTLAQLRGPRRFRRLGARRARTTACASGSCSGASVRRFITSSAMRPLPYELPRIQQWKHQHQSITSAWIPSPSAPPARPKTPKPRWPTSGRFAALERRRPCHRARPQGWPESGRGREISVRLASSGTTRRAAPGSSRTPSTATESTTKTIGLYNKKMNLSAKLPAVGFAIDFDPDRTRSRAWTCATCSELAASFPCGSACKEVVRHGPQTIATIASELGHTNVESLDRIVRRQKNVFTKVTGADGIQRIALVERRAS